MNGSEKIIFIIQLGNFFSRMNCAKLESIESNLEGTKVLIS